ncbi:hypothetical protein PSTG_01301 [Puccinia striiformis f. sp. tritici PST-78]|uniref:Protein kinase domain-containing protein n=1 Tax=Puccinia striiformis f. sp. tritici PST-78 TaxID=1165861 RepID=A0A0L0W2M0_9BASI|nr:hypothetical protein PSTG_01301 [Puccinia striiformis f. sp. tritici PST-78]
MRRFLKSALLILPRAYLYSSTSTSELEWIDVPLNPPSHGKWHIDWQTGNSQAGPSPQLLELMPTSPVSSQFNSKRPLDPASPVQETLDLLRTPEASSGDYSEMVDHGKRTSPHACRGDQIEKERQGNDHSFYQLASKKRPLDLNLSLHPPALDKDTIQQPVWENVNTHSHSPASTEQGPLSSLSSSPAELRTDDRAAHDNPVSSKIDDEVMRHESRGKRLKSSTPEIIADRLEKEIQPSHASHNGVSTITAQMDLLSQLQAAKAHFQDPKSSTHVTLTTKMVSTDDRWEEAGQSTNERTLRELRLDNLTTKVWPWVIMIWEHARKPLAQELNNILKPLVKNSIEDYLHRNHLETQGSRDAAIWSELVQQLEAKKRQIEAISPYLWTINTRVLEILGVGIMETPYLEEQTKLMNWFIGFIFSRMAPSSAHAPNDPLPRSELYRLRDKPGGVYDKILNAVNCDEHKPLFKISVPWKFVSNKPISTSQRQQLISQAVIHLLGFYYKNRNPDKWSHLFIEDRHFLLRVADFGHRWMTRPLIKQASTDADRRNGGRMMPWEDALLESVKEVDNRFKLPVTTFERHVIPAELDAEEAVPVFVDNEVFTLGSQEQKVWAWISRMIIQATISAPSEYRPTGELTRGMMNYLSGSLKSGRFSERQKIKFGSIVDDDKQLSAKLTKLFDFLWSVNTQFLERLGCDRSEETFNQEQRWIHMYFGFLLSKLNKTRNELPTDQHQHPLEQLEALLDNYFFLSHGTIRELYKVKTPERVGQLYTTMTTEDLTLTEIVTHILGNYYKNQNSQKWSQLFDNNQHLFNFLVKISSINFHRGRSSQYRQRIFPLFKSYHFLPWTEPVERWNKLISQNIKKRFELKPSLIVVDRWVEPANGANPSR